MIQPLFKIHHSSLSLFSFYTWEKISECARVGLDLGVEARRISPAAQAAWSWPQWRQFGRQVSAGCQDGASLIFTAQEGERTDGVEAVRWG